MVLFERVVSVKLAPIVLFTYNRPWHTQQVVEALQKNVLASYSELFIFSDGAKNEQQVENVNKVRSYLETITGFAKVTIIKREKNLGLANSVISAVTEIVNALGRVIVLEDDIVTSPYFLQFMNDALDFYENDEHICSINSYVYPIKKLLHDNFFLKCADCWGWATWKRAWNLFECDGKKLLEKIKARNLQWAFDFNGTYGYTAMLEAQTQGKNDSWAIRWYASCFLADKLSLYPRCSLVQNIGNDGSGRHCGVSSIFNIELCNERIYVINIPLKENRKVYRLFKLFFRKMRGEKLLLGLSITRFKMFLKNIFPEKLIMVLRKCLNG